MEPTKDKLKEAHKILLQLNVSPHSPCFEDQRRILANILADRDEKLAIDVGFFQKIEVTEKCSDEQVRQSMEDPVNRVRPGLVNRIVHKLMDEALIQFDERTRATSMETDVTATIIVVKNRKLLNP